LIPVLKEVGRYIVNSMGTADFVSVNLTRDLRYFPDFTNNSWKLLGNINEFKVPGCVEKLYLNDLARQNARSLGLLPAIDELIDRLAKYPQHQKLIVGVVDGRGRSFSGGNSVGIAGSGSGSDTRWMETMRAAQRAGISVSLVDVVPLDPMYRPSDLF